MSDYFLFRSAIRDMVRWKRIAVAIILISLPSALALLLRLNMPARNYRADEVYANLSYDVVFGFILVILAVVFATGALSQELEQKTIVYLLTRPVPRWRILLAKFAAAIVAIVVTVCLACVLLATTIFSFGGANNRSPLLTNSDIRDVMGLANRIKDAKDPVSEYLWNERMQRTRALLDPDSRGRGGIGGLLALAVNGNQKRPEPSPGKVRKQLVDDLNEVIEGNDPLYDSDRFKNTAILPALKTEAAANPPGEQRLRVNRLLLEAAYPREISHIQSVRGLIVRDLLILPVGALAYAALFLFFATVLRRPLIWGLVFAFGWESWTPSLPDKFQMISLMSYLHALAPHDKPDGESVDVTQIISTTGGEIISNGVAWTVLLCVIAGFLVLAMLAFSTREYAPREDGE